MLDRHRDQLSHMLERLVYDSYVHIDKAFLRHIFDVERMAAGSWRELFGMLPEGVTMSDILIHEYNDHLILISKHHTYPASNYI